MPIKIMYHSVLCKLILEGIDEQSKKNNKHNDNFINDDKYYNTKCLCGN